MTIGVFDSGLGGLTVLLSIKKRMPELDIIYLGDNANAPYGVRTPQDVYDMTCRGVQTLFDRGCNLVIIACNTASAVALRRMQEEWVPAKKRVLGVFVPLIEKITERQWGDNSAPRRVPVKNIALFATPATVASRAFERELGFRAFGVNVESQACDGLVDAIELGDLQLAEELVKSHVRNLLDRLPNPEVVVLGCTHYPLIRDIFIKYLGNNSRILDHPDIVADSLEDYIARHPDKVGNQVKSFFLTTGIPSIVEEKAFQLSGVKIKFEKVCLI